MSTINRALPFTYLLTEEYFLSLFTRYCCSSAVFLPMIFTPALSQCALLHLQKRWYFTLVFVEENQLAELWMVCHFPVAAFNTKPFYRHLADVLSNFLVHILKLSIGRDFHDVTLIPSIFVSSFNKCCQSSH